MISRLKVALPQAEYSGLLDLAETELRSPDEQMRYLLRQELIRRGLLREAGDPVQREFQRGVAGAQSATTVAA